VWRVCWNITGTILASSGDDGQVSTGIFSSHVAFYLHIYPCCFIPTYISMLLYTYIYKKNRLGDLVYSIYGAGQLCGRDTIRTIESVGLSFFFLLLLCMRRWLVEGQLPSGIYLPLTSSFSFIPHAQVKLWKANYCDNWKCVYPSLLTFHLLRMHRLSCGRPLPGQLDVCLSLTSYISFIAHAQVNLWKATTWTTGSVSIPHFLHFRWSCGRSTTWTTGSCVYPSLLTFN
jgi:hypothetical protein